MELTIYICTAIITLVLILFAITTEHNTKTILVKKKQTRLIKLITSPVFASSIWTMERATSKEIPDYRNYMKNAPLKQTRSTTDMEMIENSRFYLFNVFNELRAALTKPDKDTASFISKDFADIWIGKKEVDCYLKKVHIFSEACMDSSHPVVKAQFAFWSNYKYL